MPEASLFDRSLLFAFAHDLRAHLRTTLTRVQLLKAEMPAGADETQRHLADEAETAARTMGRLVDAMVSYCGVTVSRETMPLPLLLRGVLLEVTPNLTEAAATVDVPEPVGVGVPRALHTVLREIVGNSCKFRSREAAPKIRIVTTLAGADEILIEVEDNGGGVDADMTERIFLPFERLHPRNEYEGFGLGLALCRRIVEAHGGRISARAAVSGGLCVAIALPAEA